MPRPLLQITGGIIALVAAVQAVSLMDGVSRLRAHAEPAALLDGCDDVPEAVILAETLHQRGLGIERYMQDIDRRKAELATAEAQITQKLVELRRIRQQLRERDDTAGQAQSDDIARIIALYDQMKPEQAAMVLSNLPPDFAAQILVRVEPQTGARIMASVEPAQAAVLTSYMGALRAKQN